MDRSGTHASHVRVLHHLGHRSGHRRQCDNIPFARRPPVVKSATDHTGTLSPLAHAATVDGMQGRVPGTNSWRPINEEPEAEEDLGALIVRVRENLDFGAFALSGLAASER